MCRRQAFISTHDAVLVSVHGALARSRRRNALAAVISMMCRQKVRGGWCFCFAPSPRWSRRRQRRKRRRQMASSYAQCRVASRPTGGRATLTPTVSLMAHASLRSPCVTAVPMTVATVVVSACIGDCDGSGEVTVNELITMVNIALDAAPLAACTAGDSDGSGDITIDEIIAAVNTALDGCVQKRARARRELPRRPVSQ